MRDSLRTRLPGPTDRRLLAGKLEVSPFCVGAVEDPRVIGAAFDAGINFFFVTADMHWPRYEASRRGLASLLARRPSARDEIVVAAVAYVTQPEFCHAPFAEVIEAIPGLKRLDVTVAGGSYRSDFVARAEQYASHARAGVGAFGTSFHDRELAERALREGLVDIGFVRYNALHRGAERDLFPTLPARRKALLYNFTSTMGYLRPSDYDRLSIPSGYWRPKITDYYRFVLARPEIDGLLCAPRRVREVGALVRALEEGPLTSEELEYIQDLAEVTVGAARLAS